MILDLTENEIVYALDGCLVHTEVVEFFQAVNVDGAAESDTAAIVDPL
jgi:hypothetical protein